MIQRFVAVGSNSKNEYRIEQFKKLQELVDELAAMEAIPRKERSENWRCEFHDYNKKFKKQLKLCSNL